jgi:PPOX class probable F420-dependent enzyme
MTDRHLASLTTIRSDGSPHVVPVGFSYDSNDGIARVITFEGSQKVVNARRGGRAALCQIDGAHWITLEGEITAVTDAERVERAVDGYSQRYRTPQDRPDRVALEIRIDRVLGRLP